MTNDWLHPQAGTAAVLVTVAAVKGSVPREPAKVSRVKSRGNEVRSLKQGATKEVDM